MGQSNSISGAPSEPLWARWGRHLGRFGPQGRVGKQVLTLVGGTAFGQGILVLASPLLTRLYEPADYGIFALYAALVSILVVVATGRYEMAIPLPDTDEGARPILVIALAIAACSSAVLGAVVLIWGPAIAGLLRSPDLAPYLLLLPFSVFGASVFQTFNYWAIRKQAFSTMAQARMGQGLTHVGVQLALGLAKLGPWGLVVGDAAGRLLSGGWLAWRHAAREPWRWPTGFREAAWRYRRYPMVTTGSGLINTIGAQVPVVMLSALFGPIAAGLFALSARVLQVPMTLVGQAIGHVFLSRASGGAEPEVVRKECWRAFERLTRAGVAPLLLLGLCAPELFAFAFGPAWAVAGVYAQWLMPGLIVAFVTSPLSCLSIMMERQAFELRFQVSLLSGRVAALLIGGAMGSAEVGVALFSLVSAALWLGYLAWVMRLSGNRARPALWRLARSVGGGLVMVSPVILARWVGADDVVVVACTVVSALAVASQVLPAKEKPHDVSPPPSA